jgi:hypothetical protein
LIDPLDFAAIFNPKLFGGSGSLFPTGRGACFRGRADWRNPATLVRKMLSR